VKKDGFEGRSGSLAEKCGGKLFLAPQSPFIIDGPRAEKSKRNEILGALGVLGAIPLEEKKWLSQRAQRTPR